MDSPHFPVPCPVCVRRIWLRSVPSGVRWRYLSKANTKSTTTIGPHTRQIPDASFTLVWQVLLHLGTQRITAKCQEKLTGSRCSHLGMVRSNLRKFTLRVKK